MFLYQFLGWRIWFWCLNKAKWSFESAKLKIIIVYYRMVLSKGNHLTDWWYSFSSSHTTPEPLRNYSGALRSAPEHINIVAPTLQTPLIHMIFPPSCVSHTFGALRPHSGALRSTSILSLRRSKPHWYMCFFQHTEFPHTLEGYLSISLTNNKSKQHKTSNRFHKEYVYFL